MIPDDHQQPVLAFRDVLNELLVAADHVNKIDSKKRTLQAHASAILTIDRAIRLLSSVITSENARRRS